MLLARQQHAGVRGTDEAVRPGSDLAVGSGCNVDGTIIIIISSTVNTVGVINVAMLLLSGGSVDFVLLHGIFIVCIVGRSCGIIDVAEFATLHNKTKT